MNKKIGLIDVNSHKKHPNLPLMKLSAYHKARGDVVEWWDGLEHYDLVYVSKIFTDEYGCEEPTVIKAEQVVYGGTGYDLHNRLSDKAEHSYPNYSLYPQHTDTAVGFLTRGCPRGCGFCIVGEKEGRVSHKVADLDEFWRGQKRINLLDPNLLACPEHEALLLQLVQSGAWVDFTQGLDIRLITPDNVALLDRLKVPCVRFAWDDPRVDLAGAFKRYALLTGKKKRKRRVYMLTNYNSTHTQDLWRVYTLRGLGYVPYLMVYNKRAEDEHTHLCRRLARWVNNKKVFYTVERFEDYDWRI